MAEPGQFRNSPPLSPDPPGTNFKPTSNKIVGDLFKFGNSFLLAALLDARTERDSLYLENQVDEIFKKGAKGVLLARYVGKSSDSAGNQNGTYLGLSVAGSGNSKEDALNDYVARKKKVSSGQVDFTGQCTLDNLRGSAQREKPQMSAPPPGLNSAYSTQVFSEISRFRGSNTENVPSKQGPGTQTNFTETELFYVKYNDWGNMVAKAQRRRNQR